MAFLKRLLTKSEYASLDLPALGVPSSYLHLDRPDDETMDSLLRKDWAVDEERRAFLKELYLVSDHRDGLYLHLLIVEGKPLFFEIWDYDKKKKIGERLYHRAPVRNPAVLADFAPGYLEGLASEGMAVLSTDGAGVIFEPAWKEK